MKRFSVLLVVLLALTLTSAASAHYGDIWFNTARNTERNIYDKYDNVDGASCVAAPGAHLSKRDSWGNAWYDHFVCRLRTIRRPTNCLALAHITGAGTTNIVLTSYRYNGCTARDLWG